MSQRAENTLPLAKGRAEPRDIAGTHLTRVGPRRNDLRAVGVV